MFSQNKGLFNYQNQGYRSSIFVYQELKEEIEKHNFNYVKDFY